LWYVPRCPVLVNDTDIVDGVNGWEQYIIASVCAKVMVKQEMDPSPFAAEKESMRERIIDEAANRNAGDPSTVTDVYDTGWDF